MGNNTSTSRKSAAAIRHSAAFRKSSQLQTTNQNLEEEFSDLILHEVKRQKQQTHDLAKQKDKFSQDLIEDEYNELNDGLLDSDPPLVLRSIIPDNNSDNMDSMDVDGAAGGARGVSVTVASMDNSMDNSMDLINDLLKVDFTKIAALLLARKQGSHLPSTSLLRLPGPSNLAFGHNASGGGVNAGGNAGTNSTGGLGSSRNSFSELVPVEIKWVNATRENIAKVAIIGSFSNWRDVIKLKRSSHHPNEYSTTVKLPLGVHKLLYIVNNEYRVSEQLPTATDQEGIFFNWFEVLDPHRLFNHSQNQQTHSADATTPFDANIIQVAGQHDALLIQRKLNSFLMKVSRQEKAGPSHEHVEYQDENKYLTYHTQALLSFVEGIETPSDEYSSEIPEMFVNYDYFKNKSADYELPEPPQLPAHLNNVLLNKMLTNQQQNHANIFPQLSGESAPRRPTLRRADSLYYASNKEAYHLLIPNHVILNHLMTTLIRNDVLTVACITRYSGKFVTQIMHSPADTLGAGE